uniref:Uncharacterized protein n=1 Tax=Lepeophtheirus salmonis TaxID=72036 RepID=A0A0K2UEV3_LEPSM
MNLLVQAYTGHIHFWPIRANGKIQVQCAIFAWKNHKLQTILLTNAYRSHMRDNKPCKKMMMMNLVALVQPNS